MKKTLKYLLIVIVLLNLIIIISGKTWLYKAISITYFKGYTSSYIEDFSYFPSNEISKGDHQPWLEAKDYNNKSIPDFLNDINEKFGTVAYLIIQNDSIKHEQYWQGYSADTMSNSFSMAKTFVSTLIGIAIKEGKIQSVNQSVCDFIPEFCEAKKSKITIEHLLTMSSGLDWDESYFNPLGQTAEAYYGSNLRKLVLNIDAIEEPGEIFKYHSSCTQILAFIVEVAMGKTISELLSDKLWAPLGSRNSALWNIDAEGGDEKAFCCINSNARDFARLGKLYMNFGSWNNIQILDTSYIKQAIVPAKLKDRKGQDNINYGYQIWITNKYDFDIFYARGHWGQYVICIPEKNMIIVRLGRKYGKILEDNHHNDFYSYIDAALEMYSN
jgi:CubicO group peptidase (beta-lactamase class C family)